MGLLNIIDYIVVTMSTIGFGDFYVRDLMSWAFILLVSLVALTTFPVYVVAVTNYLTTNYHEKVGILLLNCLDVKE